MSSEPRPAATPIEPGSGALPADLAPAITDPTTPILLLVAPTADDAAAHTAIQLAEGRARAGEATVLADASVREPRLHQALEVDNVEGLADVFLFGASLDRVRVRPAGWDFDFIPTGLYVPHPAEVLGSGRWDRVAQALEAEGARLLVFVPADEPGLGILSERAGQAVLIGRAAQEGLVARALHPSCRIIGTVEPARAQAPAPAPAERSTDEPADEAELGEPVVYREADRPRRKVSPVLWVLLAAALAAGGWFLYSEYLADPAETAEPVQDADPAVQAEPTAPGPPSRGEPVETPLPVSVQVAAHQDLDVAQEHATALAAAEPDIPFFLVPIESQSRLYYRVTAGYVADRTAAEALMNRLVEAGHRMAADDWALRPAEQAFLLGEYDTAAEAEQRVRELAGLRITVQDEAGDAADRPAPIPAYVVPLTYETGPPRYRVYAGAYASPAEAGVLAAMLEEVGLDAELVARTGEPSQEGS